MRMFRWALVALGIGALGCEAPTVQSPVTGPSVAVGNLAPTVRSVDPPTARPGDRVTISGDFIKSATDVSVFVTFNGFDAEDVVMVDSHTITAKVPATGCTGYLVVWLGTYRGNETWYVVEPATPSAGHG